LQVFDGSSYTDFGRPPRDGAQYTEAAGVQFTPRPLSSIRLRDRENRKQKNALGALDFCSRAAGRRSRPAQSGVTASPPARPAQGDSVASLPGTRGALRARCALQYPRTVLPRALGVAEWVAGFIGRRTTWRLRRHAAPRLFILTTGRYFGIDRTPSCGRLGKQLQ
jgi:hypothetical protein